MSNSLDVKGLYLSNFRKSQEVVSLVDSLKFLSMHQPVDIQYLKLMWMANPIRTGELGENKAAEYLLRKGYDILERNWRSGKREIDIIASLGDLLIIVEVKTRTNLSHGRPEAFVDLPKWENVARAAGVYMATHGYEWEVRFDIIAVSMSHSGYCSIEHFKDVYFPGRS